MSELLKKQKFGVEVEFTGITRTMAAEAVAEILGSHAAGPDRTCYRTYTIRDSKRRIWKVMRDSSICPVRKAGRELMDEYRVEFVTPPLNYEDIEALQTIIRKFKELGGVSHSSCGIHIHVDGANHTATSLRRLVNFFFSRQEIIYDALAVGNRKDRWCRPVCKDLLDTMKKEKDLDTRKVEEIWYSSANDQYHGGIDHSHYNSTRYHALKRSNFSASYPIIQISSCFFDISSSRLVLNAAISSSHFSRWSASSGKLFTSSIAFARNLQLAPSISGQPEFFINSSCCLISEILSKRYFRLFSASDIR